MRAAYVLPCLGVLCTACSGETGAVPEAAEGDEMIACAVGGSSEIEPVCAIDRVKSEKGLMLVVRHPDGAFRRFEVRNDGTGLVPADGAEQAVSLIDDDVLQLRFGSDVYRFPAKKIDRARTP